ncbi:MAG: aldolase [Methanomicrobium sp.]|nr:aldolase [Methanomicrobium sp.]
MTIESDIVIPADVPKNAEAKYKENYKLITGGSGRLMLFAGDQKTEHLNDDFYGADIHPDDADPEHMFRIASGSRVGVFASQLGLIARYGKSYPNVPYLVKINSKTHLVKTDQKDPLSTQLWTVQQVVDLRESSKLKIAAVGYTIYLGSEYEGVMLSQAAQIINEAHKHGLVVVLWIYPRGKAVKNEKDAHLIAGAAGTAAALGADFVKVNPPKEEGKDSAELLKEAVKAAGRTKLVCAGGSSTSAEKFLSQLYAQIHTGGASGNATGRNIHQKSLDEAIRMCNAISAITMDNADVAAALKIYNGNKATKAAKPAKATATKAAAKKATGTKAATAKAAATKTSAAKAPATKATATKTTATKAGTTKSAAGKTTAAKAKATKSKAKK